MNKKVANVGDILVTYCPNVKDPGNVSTANVRDVFRSIKYPASSDFAKCLEKHTLGYRRIKSKKLKEQSPAVCWAAVFPKYRSCSSEYALTGLALMDADHLSKEVMEAVMRKVQELSYVLMAWTSISGNGLHIVIRMPEGYEWKQGYALAQKQLIADVGVEGFTLDGNTSDIARACFLNTDENAYGNSGEVTPMLITIETGENQETPRRKDVPRRGVCNRPDIRLFMADLERYFSAKMAGKVQGSTATPTAGLAGICNTRGYDEAEAVEACWKQFGDRIGQTKEEFRKTFSLVYRTYANQFASKKDEALFEGTHLGRAVLATEATIDVLEKDIEFPVLSKEVYELLPPFFTDVLKLEKREVHEADAVVIGLLPLLGAALNNTEVYEAKWVYPAVYTAVVGKPASGKGAVSQIQFLSALWENHLQKYYEGDDTQPVHRVGGDITLAKHVETMETNGVYPLLQHDSEMNAMAKANKNRDTGGYDTVLNKAYEGEDVLRSTKTAGHIVVHQPKLQLSLTGTKGQFYNAFENYENGLTTRILGYVMPEKVMYKKLPYIESEDALKEREKAGLQERYERLAASQANRNTPIRWVLSEKHTGKLNKFIEKQLEEGSDTPYEESTIIRMRAKVIRIAAILSTVRLFETEGDAELSPLSTGYLTIDDASFRCASLIVETSLEHTLALESMLSEGTGRKPMHVRKDWRNQFYDKLPEAFRYSEGLQLCLEYGKRKDSWKKALRYWQEKGLLVKREQDGAWVKLHPAPEANASKQP